MNDINVIQIEDNLFAVKKELLAPKYYKNVPAVKDPEMQIEVEGIKYVLLKAEEIEEDIDELTSAHPMDAYDYPFRGMTYSKYTEDEFAYPHQIYSSRWMLTQGGRGLHLNSSMGVGKTLSTLWVIDYLFRMNRIKKVLIVAPKVVMKSAWLKEINNELMHLTTCLKVNAARDRVSSAQIDIINHDGLTSVLTKFSTNIGHGVNKRIVYNFAECKEQYDIIIYDEKQRYMFLNL